MVGAILIAAPAPHGRALLDAALAADPKSAWFYTPSSRDPTLELPDAVVRVGAAVVILVDPEREEPSTLDVIRQFGAKIVVWSIQDSSSFHRPAARIMLARRRWIARAADAVAVTVSRRVSLLRDRTGRPSIVVEVPRSPADAPGWAAALGTLIGALGSNAE